MSDLREAAESILNNWEESGAQHPIGELVNNSLKLARAYLEEHPADGDGPVDEAFVRSLGRIWHQDKMAVMVRFELPSGISVRVVWESNWLKQWRCVVIIRQTAEREVFIEMKIRDDVLRLLAALGIDLKK